MTSFSNKIFNSTGRQNSIDMLNLQFLWILAQLQLTTGWILSRKQLGVRKQQNQLLSSSDSWNPQKATGIIHSLDDNDVISAAATVTKESSPLLGLRSLGVDYGLARTGLAITIGFAPQQLKIIEEENSTRVVDEVIRYAKFEGASQIILGLPLHKNGTESEQTGVTRIFGDLLARKAYSILGKVPVILWDERYTSKEAAARAHAQHPDRALRGTLDAEAACIILENYYFDGGIGAEVIRLDEDVKNSCLEEYHQHEMEIKRQKQAESEKRDANLRRRQERMEQIQDVVSPSNAKLKKKKKKKK